MRYLLSLLVLLSFVSCEEKENTSKESLVQLKRIERLIEKNRNTLLNNESEKKLLRKELNLLKGKTDTTSLYSLYLLTKSAFENYNGDVEDYLKVLSLNSKDANDSLSYARFLRLNGFFNYRNSKMGLAQEDYLKAEKIFKNLKDKNEIIEVNLNIAYLLLYINDFTGAERYLTKINTQYKSEVDNKFKIKLLNAKTMILSQSSNHSFSINQLEIEIKDLMKDETLKIHEKQYLKAILAKIYFIKNISSKSHILLNEVLNDRVFVNYYYHDTFDLTIYDLINKENLDLTNNIKNDYQKLVKEIVANNIPKDKLMIYSDYANYLFRIKDYNNSLEYAKKAFDISKEVKYSYSSLNSLLLQAKIDKSNAVKYFIEYDKLIDELINYQRFQKDNFYKIQLETNQIAQAKEKAENQRNQVVWAIGILLFVSAFLFIIYRNRLMNNKMEFQQKHQKSNERIHELILQNQALEVEVRQKEQRRIAMEIHDGVLNQLASIRFKLFKLELNQEAQTIKEALQNVNSIQNIEVELRNLTHDLHAQSSNERVLLIPIIQQLIQVHQEIYNIQIELQKDNWDWEQLSAEIKMGFTRIIQEALHNVVKHAKATQVLIQLQYESNNIILRIKDNGKGLDFSSSISGIGLANIHLRAEQIQSKVKITSKRNQGTEIQINTPVFS